MWFLKTVLGWFVGPTLDRVLDTVDSSIDNETERQRIRADTIQTWVHAQASIANSRQWWFPLFFLVPLGLWFSSVCIYSMLWCANCAFPQTWTIAALPPPLDEWSGWIVTSVVGLGAITKVTGAIKR